MKTNIIIQARMGSTRLPGKVMKDLAGQPVLWHILQRCQVAKVNKIIVATTINKEDEIIEKSCKKWSVPFFRGSSEDVLDRYYQASLSYPSDAIVRITSDCPLIDPDVISLVINNLNKNDYVTNVLKRNFPRGLDVEVFSSHVLAKAHQEAKQQSEREHVTLYMRENKYEKFKIKNVDMPEKYCFPQFRLTLDTIEDYRLFQRIYNEFFHKGYLINVPEVLTWLVQHPEIASLNATVNQKLI